MSAQRKSGAPAEHACWMNEMYVSDENSDCLRERMLECTMSRPRRLLEMLSLLVLLFLLFLLCRDSPPTPSANLTSLNLLLPSPREHRSSSAVLPTPSFEPAEPTFRSDPAKQLHRTNRICSERYLLIIRILLDHSCLPKVGRVQN
jgi:hypothetical protein